jgi:predicted nucleotidyltransferase
MDTTARLSDLEQLEIPGRLRDDLSGFVSQLVDLYKTDLLSVIAFGSAVAGGYSEASSDLNLLVVYNDLNIADLRKVSELAQHWLKKRRFVPRFLSARNFTNSSRYFQIDLLEMRDAHAVLYGKDLFADIEIRRADLHWQLAHEIKRMRMRIKQQFWMAAGNADAIDAILRHRFASFLHLLRALLFLEGMQPSSSQSEMAKLAVSEVGIDSAFVEQMLSLRAGKLKLKGASQIEAFSGLMDAIRIADERVDRVVV